jgi:cytochrome oxidase assembly protein ShyY1
VNLWRLAASRRWIGIFGFTLAFAVACVGLGQWQFDRRAEARSAIELLDLNWSQPTQDLDEVVATVDEFDATEKWRSVRLSGEYLPEVLYVRTRSGPGGVGFEQLAMLAQTDGTVFVVNRGWVRANGDNSAPEETPALPRGPVNVTAHLIPGEMQVIGRNAPTGQIATIHLAEIDERTDGDVFTGWYGRLASETPSAPIGASWSKPVLDEGPHLSYALQWYVFAAMGFFGYGWALRKEYLGDAAPKPRARKRASDEDIEDQALDAR